MKRKLLSTILLFGALIGLSGCGLFNDNDIAIKNSYNVPEPTSEEDPDAVRVGGVAAQTIEQVPEAHYFENVSYASNDCIPNTYKEGFKYSVNEGKDYPANRTTNNYDLYVPHSTPRNKDHVVILFIHGGAWVSGFKTDVNPYVYDFANRGYVTATIRYTLLSKEMNDSSLSIFRNLDEINACVTSIKSSLGELGFDTTKTHLVIGGASSGAHLSMLYSYSRGDKCDLPISFIVNAVGPVDIKPDNWKCFTNNVEESIAAGIDYAAIEAQKLASNLSPLHIAGEAATVNWNEYHTMRIANGMCGIPYSLDVVKAATEDDGATIAHYDNSAYVSMTEANGGEDLLSVTHYINSTNKIPMVCAYGGKDGTVGIAQFATLEKALMDNGIDYDFTYFPSSDHKDISATVDEAHYNEFIGNIANRCAAIQPKA